MILMQLSEDLFFGLPTLEYSRDRANMIQAYKIMNNIDDDKNVYNGRVYWNKMSLDKKVFDDNSGMIFSSCP